MMTTVPQETSRLTDLVRRFQVCWEVWPECAMVGSEKRQIGFVLEICGTHEAGTERPLPGCEHCRDVFIGLREIAEHIVPQEARPSISEIGPYDRAIHYSPTRQNRPEVNLALTILHQAGIEDPLDACQVRCLSETKQRLKQLGAQEGRWAPPKEAR